MELRIYDRELNYIGSIEGYSSLSWTRKYFEPGEFGLQAPITEKTLKYLQPGNLVSKRGSAEAGIIEAVENDEENGTATRGGRFLSSYFSRRLIKNTYHFSGKVEVAMRSLVGRVTPIPRVQLGALQGFIEKVEFQATMKNLCTYQTKLAKASGLGYRLRPDFREKILLFEVYQGVDRSTAQKVNPRVIFSKRYENLNNPIYRYNDQNQATLAYVGGDGEGSKRTYVTVGGGSGLDLREIFVDARDLQKDELTDAEYTAALEQRGLTKLAENIITESMECDARTDVNFTYKKHFDLGDIVTVKKEAWGIKMHKRITEVTEVYESGGMYINVALGDAMPETIDWSDD